MPQHTHPLRRWLIGGALLLLVFCLPQCISIRMSDKKIDNWFRNKPQKPRFGYVTSAAKRPVHYAQLGADSLPTVLFIHGSPGSWDAFIDYFADTALIRRALLVSVDRPGFGKSGLGQPERSLAVQAAQLAPLLHLGRSGRKPIVVGHSLGGPVAARLAMDYPDAVGALVLLAPSIDPTLEAQEWYRHVGNVFPFRQLLPTEFDVSNQEILPLKGELQIMVPLWARISVPVTVLQGDKDGLVPPGNADFARRMLTHTPTTIQMLPGMNHFIPWNRHEQVRSAILTLLDAPSMSAH
jgi:pimeloyl-ACP methyl ester carboxylesterase